MFSFMCNNIFKAIPSPRAHNGTRNWEGLDLCSHYNPKIFAELGNKETKLLWYGKMHASAPDKAPTGTKVTQDQQK